MEKNFVDWLKATLPGHSAVRQGIGDDAAVLASSNQRELVVTTDLLADGTHFLSEEVAPERIGRKCLAANLSDLAAMAAEPSAVVTSLLLPRESPDGLSTTEVAKRVTEGIAKLAQDFDIPVIGGDTNVWKGRLAISITAFGYASQGGPLLRSGAQLGDRLLVTGRLGGSIQGRHLDFTPRVREALQLVEKYDVHAGMDLTDGLAVDLHRMCEASNVGASLDANKIPVSDAAHELAASSSQTPLDHALADGEDFELLLAVPRDSASAMLRDQPLGCGLSEVGEVISEGVWLVDAEGQRAALPPSGYLHG